MPLRRTSNHIPSSPAQDPMKQGIVTILGGDADRSNKPGSIRKTLSADMSSKKWLQQNGFFSPIKKIDSSQEIAADHDGGQEIDDVWRSIQKSNEMKKPPESGVWGSILTQKSDNSLLPPPAYVFPAVKRSGSGLSEKSLEICTESLGSETGSDCFSGLGGGAAEEEDMQRSYDVKSDDEGFPDLHVAKSKKSPARPLPPPLPSIAGGDGASLRMHSHRENGRLVLEAVSVAPRNYFHAQRHDGRLVLTLLKSPGGDDHGGEAAAEEEEEEEEVENDVEEEEESVVEQNLSLPTKMISVHKSGLVMKKLIAVGNINPKWSKKCDDMPQSLPPRPPTARPAAPATAFNAYEYFWRSKPTSKMNQSKTEQSFIRGCKEARRSQIWEPYCIATS